MTTRRRILVSFLILAWTCGVTLARGWSRPNDFAQAHWYLDYRLGFLKRALVGTLADGPASFFGPGLPPGAVAVLGGILTGALALGLLVISWRALSRPGDHDGVLWAGLVFFSSPFIVMSGHLIGYFDALFHLLTILAVFLVLRGRYGAAAAVGGAAILVHESFLLTGLPLVGLALFVNRDRLGYREPGPWLVLLAPVVVFLLTGTAVLAGDQEGLRTALLDRWAARGLELENPGEIATWLTTSLPEFARQQGREYLPRLIDPGALACVLPSLAVLLGYLFMARDLRPLGRTALAVLAATGAPLLMHAVAWDGPRIWTYPLFGAWTAGWILDRGAAAPGRSDALILLAGPALFLNVFQHLPLMDGQVERFSILGRLGLYAPAILLTASLSWRRFREDHRGFQA